MRSACRGTTRAGRTAGSTRRFPGRVLSTPSVAVLPGRDRLLIWMCVGLVTVLAWAYLIQLDRQMSADMRATGMDLRMVMATPHTATDIALTFAMWTVMMVGMMAGSAAPVIMLFAAAQKGRGQHAPF